jgi:hypothetical protein
MKRLVRYSAILGLALFASPFISTSAFADGCREGQEEYVREDGGESNSHWVRYVCHSGRFVRAEGLTAALIQAESFDTSFGSACSPIYWWGRCVDGQVTTVPSYDSSGAATGGSSYTCRGGYWVDSGCR